MKIHVHGGGVSAETAETSGIEGEHLAFREALIDGPVRSGIPDDEWIEDRARHLANDYGEDLGMMRQVSEEELAMIDDLVGEEELLLWFDRDLFCQVNLMFILGRLAEAGFDGSCTLIESHSGDAGSLDHSIRHLAIEEIDAYARAWLAYGSEDPQDLLAVLQNDLPAALASALALHVERYPSATNGLGRTEQALLDLLDERESTFVALFQRFAELESGYGLGDAQVWTRLRSLEERPEPLVTMTGRDDLLSAEVSITTLGRKVRRGEADAIETGGIDLWLGGVHLTPQNLWRREGDALKRMSG